MMTPIYSTNDLLEYSKRLSRQKEVLKISTIFNPIEKIEVLEAIENLEKIVNKRLSRLQDIEDAINL
jgi:hypothetical protein